MNTAQDISDIRPWELRGVLVCDALLLRDGIASSNPKATASVMASGHPTTLVKK
jgi:hypothetical protein